MALGDWIEAVFAFLGAPGLLAAMFLIFLADAAIFPALPEVFIVAFYFQLTFGFQWAPPVAAITLLALALAGDVSGNAGLYALVRFLKSRGRVPARIERIMQKWVQVLLVKDERVVLVNRIAPAVPLTGAFIAVCGWDIRRALGYVVLGGFLKYAFLLLLAAWLSVQLSPDLARLITFAAVIVFVVASVAAGQWRKKKWEAGA